MASLEAPLLAQWMKVVLAPPEASVRPNRAYTIRHLDSTRARVVMDFVLHDDDGSLSRWASLARTGDRVHLGAPRGGHRIDAGARWRLLVGDETALPAIASILRMLPDDGVPIRIFVEVPSAEEAQALRIPLNGTIEWLARGAARHGGPMETAVGGPTAA